MHVFFDLDGTLTNPKVGIANCIRHALEILETPVPSEAEMDQWIGPPLQESFTILLKSPDRAAQGVALYRDRFATVGLFENHVYEGIPEMLATLSAAAHTLWVTTSKPQIFAERITQHFQLSQFFAKVYGSDLDGTRTHKADLLAHVLQTENIDPVEAIMVGDRRQDILGAKQNGIRAIGVLWGFGSKGELQDAGAKTLCNNPWDLSQAIQIYGEEVKTLL